MRKVKSTAYLVVAILLLVSVISACSSNKSNEDASSQTPTGNSEAAESEGSEPSAQPTESEGGEPSAQPAVSAEPLGKYDPPIEVTVIQPFDENTKFVDGESAENNLWTKKYADELGINVKHEWLLQGPMDQYYQKLNVAIASNDLADVVTVSAQQLKQLAEANQIADLTGVYEQYALPFVKESMNADNGFALKSATFNGKLLAIPRIGSDIDEVPMLWVRTDWLNNLGLPEPKTIADVLAISEAFTNKDPDGNKKKDTFGLALSKDLNGGFPGFEGFLNGFGAYYNVWLKDASGNLVNSNIQPEVKTALAELQKLYRAGQIDKEFATKDGGKIAEAVSGGKIGMYYGLYWTPAWPLQDGKNLDPKMEWKAYPLPSVSGAPTAAQVPFTVSQYYVVKQNSEHPEAAIKLLNLWFEDQFNVTEEVKGDPKYDGIETFKYAVIRGEPITKNMDIFKRLVPALKAKDPTGLKPVEKDLYNTIQKFEAGDNLHWATQNIYGINGSFTIIDYYVQNNLIKRSEFFGSPTKTMGEKGSTLDTLLKETFTKIIMDAAPVEEFDKFVESWKKLGGDEITTEVNAWKATQ